MLTKYVFIFLSIIAIASSMMVIISKKPVHSVLYLTLAFFSIAGHYILLNAQFLAVVHIIVYAGAIMVLFLFTVMLLNLNTYNEAKQSFRKKFIVIICCGILLITLTGAIRQTDIQLSAGNAYSQAGMAKNLGRVLFTDFILPFDLSAFLFLAAIVGAVLLGKNEKKDQNA